MAKKNKSKGTAINLLMLENGNDYHYVLTKDLNRLIGKSSAVPNLKIFCPTDAMDLTKGA